MVYSFEVELIQGDAGPVIVGTGIGLTVTGNEVAAWDVQPFALVKFTLTVRAPAVLQLMVTLLLVDVPPPVMVPPDDTVHM